MKNSSAAWVAKKKIHEVCVDERHMAAALALAERGLGAVWPNPAVGCLLVRAGRTVATNGPYRDRPHDVRSRSHDLAVAVIVQSAFPGLIGVRGKPSLIVPAAIAFVVIAMNAQVTIHNIQSPRTDTLGRIGFDMVTVPSSQPTGSILLSRPRMRGSVITSIVRVEVESLDAALEYVQQNRRGSRYLLAADSYNTAARVALLTGEPVLPLYSEYQDVRVTEFDTLKELVDAGDVRFVLIAPLMQYMDRELFSYVTSRALEDLTSRFGLPRDEMRLLRIAR